MSYVVYGASGYTGRLVVAELARRGASGVLSGRDRTKLDAVAASVPGTWQVKTATVNDHATMVAAFAGAEVVINCAGPFTHTGSAVVNAAISAGCHYLDTTGEQAFLHGVHERFGPAASAAGVTVVPAMAADGAPGDLLSHLVGADLVPLTNLTVAYRLVDFGLSRGSLQSALEAQAAPEEVYRAGHWVRAPRRTRRRPRLFPGATRPEVMMRLAGAEVITVPRHLDVGNVEVHVNATAMAPTRPLAKLLPTMSPIIGPMLRTPVKSMLGAVVGRMPEGPAESARRAVEFTIIVEAERADGTVAYATAVGSDVYGSTAVIAVEAAARLLDGEAEPGVLAPSQAFDPADFLRYLEGHGYTISIAAPASAQAQDQPVGGACS